MNKLIVSVFAICASPGLAMEPAAVTNAANFLLESALGAEHACFQFTKGAVESNGWTPEECSDILLLAERTLRNSTNEFDVYRRRNAVGMIGDFGGTNALQELSVLMRSTDDRLGALAGEAFLHVARANPALLSPLKAEMARSSRGDRLFVQSIYDRVDFDLTYGGPSPDLQRNLVRFLLDQVVVEQGERAALDELLCREVPKWRASPQRAENAAKMIREHPDDAQLVSFFETVRTNTLEAAGTTLADGEGASSPPLAVTNRGSSSGTNAESDPWAGLLDDLPEKKPWVRPSGSEPLAHSSPADSSPSAPPSPPAPEPFQAMLVFPSDLENETDSSASESRPESESEQEF